MGKKEHKSLKATIAGISAHENEQDVEILREKTKIRGEWGEWLFFF